MIVIAMVGVPHFFGGGVAMQDDFLNNYKRQYFIKELLAAGVKKVAGQELELATNRELRFAVVILRLKEGR